MTYIYKIHYFIVFIPYIWYIIYIYIYILFINFQVVSVLYDQMKLCFNIDKKSYPLCYIDDMQSLTDSLRKLDFKLVRIGYI